MRKLIFLFGLFCSSSQNGNAQNDAYFDLSSKVFFNTLYNTPDTLIKDFFNRYFPSYTHSSEPNSYRLWIGPDTLSKVIESDHGMAIESHPFVSDFEKAWLYIICKENKDYLPRINGLRFIFNNDKERDENFNRLLNLYDRTLVNKVKKQENDYTTVIYSALLPAIDQINFAKSGNSSFFKEIIISWGVEAFY